MMKNQQQDNSIKGIGVIEFNKTDANIKINDKNYFIYRSNIKNAFDGDTIEYELFSKNNKRLEARVIKVIERKKRLFIGKLEKKSDGTIFLVIETHKHCPKFLIEEEVDINLLLSDYKVVVELIEFKRNGKFPTGKIVKVLDSTSKNEVEMNSIMYEYGLPIEFPPMVEDEANYINTEITDEDINNRVDLRNVTTFTIDPKDAKDFDDALSIRTLDSGNIEIGVHIADVSHYIKPNSELDEEAFNRGNSVYLVDRCVPMLPEKLSNGACSLNPNENKLCFSVIYEFDSNFGIVKEFIGRSVIYSDRRFTYEEAQDIIEGNDGDYKDEILLMDKIAKIYRGKRFRDGSIEIGTEEVKFILDGDEKTPIGVYTKVQKDANKLIEEFMLMANKSIATFFKKNKLNGLYRIHEEPKTDKIMELNMICKNFGHDLISNNMSDIKSNLNTLSNNIKDKPEENIIKNLIVRSMQKAGYSNENKGHWGLGFDNYTHFTSPIRRYSDLIVHRILEKNLKNGGYTKEYKNKIDNYDTEKLITISQRINRCELTASRAERDSIKYKQIEFLMNSEQRIFKGVISSLTDWGMYVELEGNKCDGLCKNIKLLKHDDYTYVNKNTGETYRLGDSVMVSVSNENLDLINRKINFILI